MKFDSLEELRIYDEMAQPIIIIDDKNRIIHCNSHCEKFFKILFEKSYKNEDINNMIRFRNKEDGKIQRFDFFNMDKERFVCNTEVNVYAIMETKIVMIKAAIGNQPCKMLVIESKIEKPSFHTLFFEGNENNNAEIDNKFNFVDINEAVEQCEGERISSQLSKGIVNSTPTGVVVERNGKIIAVNKSAKEILSMSRQQEEEVFLGRSLLEIVKMEPIQYNDNYIQEQYNCSSKPNIVDRKLIKKDGSIAYCEISTLYIDENGERQYIYLLKEITKRVQVEKNIISNKNSYMKLLELLPIGVMIHTNNKFNSGNKTQQKILGVEDINALTNQEIVNMIHEDYRQLYRQMYYETFSTGKTTEVNELKMIKKDGTEIEVEMIMMTVSYEGDKSVVMLTQEITDKKKAKIDKLKLEETIKFDQLKTQFISNVSHELKTPLNIILSTVQLLQYNHLNIDDEQVKRYLNLTKVNSYRLLRLINNLIDGTRIDVGNLKMNFGNYNIVKIVEDITMEAVKYVEEKGLTITFDTDVEEKIIGVDKDNIERIMLNLLSNAVKFSKENGKIVVQVIDEGEIVKIKVQDDGKGICKEAQQRIFDKFVQVEDLFTRSHEGSGIGLSLVKSIVENHGGNIFVKSEPGIGSEFTVELPNILSKKPRGYNTQTINQVSSTEKVKIEFSDI